MRTYQFARTDMYLVTVEAQNKTQAQQLVDTQDEYLNSGSYAGSRFELVG